MPRAPIASRPSTSTLSPSSSSASALAYSPSTVGVRSLPGRFCRSRARLTAAPSSAASATAASASARTGDQQSLELARRTVGARLGGGGLVALEAVGAEDRALDERSCELRASVAGHLPAERAARELAGAVEDRRGGHARALGAEALARAEADEQPALALGVGQRERLEAAAGLAGGEQCGELRGCRAGA